MFIPVSESLCVSARAVINQLTGTIGVSDHLIHHFMLL